MTPIWRGIVAVLIAALLGAIYWFFGPKTPDEIASDPEVSAAVAPATAAIGAPEPTVEPDEPSEMASDAEAPDEVEPEVVASAAPEAAEEDTGTEMAQEDAQNSAFENDPITDADTAAEDNTTEQARSTAPDRSGDRKSAAEFDIVRVEPGGSTLIAGRSAPGAEIKLMMDGKEAGIALADNSGNFVMFSELGPSNGPRVLTLTETWIDGTELDAEASVILGPVAPLEDTANDAEEVAAVEAEAADTAATRLENEPAEVVVEATPEVVTEEPVIAAAPEPQTEAPETGDAPVVENAPDVAVSAPVAPTVLIADDTGVRVLQSAGDLPEALTNVSIDTISYDAAGDVSLAGRATGANVVRVYLNNSLLVEADIADGGQWRTGLPEVDTGTYTLRVDEVNAAGEVISRAETPFRRESVEAIRSIEAETELAIAPVSLITVQPGNTLWGIAREKYGEGPLFVRVFDANTDRIRNPDLIYPGQIFTVPD